MARKDARFRASRPTRWQVLSFALSALALLAVCIGARYFWGAPAATAQTPRTNTEKNAAPAAGAKPGAGGEAAAQPGSPPPLTIMAVVNNEQISRQDLARECLLRYGGDVLETLVNKHLIMAACQQRKVVISEKEVDDEINKMAAKFGLSADRWLKLLEEQRHVNPNQYAQDIVWPTLALRKLAKGQIEVSPEELKQGMESEFGRRVRARIIIVSDPRKAEQIRAEAAANPESFGDLAKEHSEDKMSASARGMIPPIRMHAGDPTVEKAAFALKEGAVSPVVAVAMAPAAPGKDGKAPPVAKQYVILKCDKREEPVYIAPEHQKDAQSRIVDQLTDKKLRSAAETLFKQLQEESQVVNVYNDEKLKAKMPGVAATINGGQITIAQLSEACLTRHGQSVLDGEINRLILKQELARRKVQVTKQDLNQEVERAARLNDFVRKDGSVNVDGWLKKVTEEEGATEELYFKDAVWPTVALKNLVGNVEITADDLEKAFQANYGPRVDVLAIVMGSHRQATTVWDMARTDPTDQNFARLAAQYSIEPSSKANGGKVPPIQRYGGQPKLEEEAFKLKPGELSSIVVVGDKFVLMRCLGRTKPITVERKRVEGELRADLAEKKLRMEMGKKFDALKEGATVDNNLAGTSQSPKAPKSAAAGSPGQTGRVAPAGFNQTAPASPAPGVGIVPAPRAGSTIRTGGK